MANFMLINNILLLTIFNIILSLKQNHSNPKRNLLEESKKIIIQFQVEEGNDYVIDESDNEVYSFNLNNNTKVEFNSIKKDTFHISIFPFNLTKDNFQNDSLVKITNSDNSLLHFEIDLNETEESTTNIRIFVEKGTNITMYKVINNNYEQIQGKEDNDQKTIKENKNIIRFLTEKEEIIKFKFIFNDTNLNLSYGIIDLHTDKLDYIPSAFSFKTLYNDKIINENNQDKEYEKELKNPYFKNKDVKYSAFIFSLRQGYGFTVIINLDKIMQYFLIGSIVLALVLAVVTFFLIRRKQTNAEDEILDDKPENEDDNE